MLIGAHVSPAGGPANAVTRGEERACRAIQIFNQSPRAWRSRVYSDDEVAAFHAAMDGSAVEALVIHAVYLLNCASEDTEIRDKSLAALTVALNAGAQLRAVGVVLHPGSALKSPPEEAL
ncbi:MAG TPA: TIM barrel protein, partial [Solirubrobacter sp.]|nr:TIM barrel protein [Solirubrobacter sp.]